MKLPRIGHIDKAFLATVAVLALGLEPAPASAEPYIAVETGLKCVTCHTNPTGGGKRNTYGMTYARTQIAEWNLFQDEETQGWNSEVTGWLGLGGDYRGGYSKVSTPASGSRSDWSTEQLTAYVELRAIPGLLTIYADEQLSPGESLNRETYLLLTPADGRFTIKAGQFFLPFGHRLQDDATFVRQRSGINFDTPDDGVELGLELARWSVQSAFTNGTAGAGSVSGKDQVSLAATHVRPRWRVGTSYNRNDDPLGDRTMFAFFGGFKTGPISWLAEVDFIEDEQPGNGHRDMQASLIEGNWRIGGAHNLKAAYEFLDPSNLAGEDERERYSIVWEYSPIQLLQTRAGYRSYNGVPADPASNRNELFVEFHAYF